MYNYKAWYDARNNWYSEDLCPDVDKLFEDRKVAYQQLCGYVSKTWKSDRTEYTYVHQEAYICYDKAGLQRYHTNYV